VRDAFSVSASIAILRARGWRRREAWEDWKNSLTCGGGPSHVFSLQLLNLDCCTALRLCQIRPATTSSATYDKSLSYFTMSNSELAASYAALILADDGVEITVCLLL